MRMIYFCPLISRLPYWQDTLNDVVLEAVICFDCRNEKKEEGGFLLSR